MLKGIKKKREEKWYTEEEYEVNSIDTGETKERKIKKALNIIFIIALIIMAMITIDVICVSRYNTGPFFAVRTSVYKDGGTKTYYGLGYKVIKYHQTQGRRDTNIGLWTMSYSVEPTTISALDLAIEFRNYPEQTNKKYYGKFLRITGTVADIDNQKNQLTLQYTDPDDAYTLDIVCTMAEENYDLKKITEKEQKTIIGTVSKFSISTVKEPNTLYINDCFTK